MTAVTADAQERFDRLESLKREVRKAHRKLSADQVTALATLHELIIAEMVASRKPAGDRLLMVSREIAVQTPLPTPDPIKVMVEFAEGIVGMTTCPHCHQAFEVPDYVAPVRERKPADEVIDLEATEIDPNAKRLSAPAAANGKPVVPVVHGPGDNRTYEEATSVHNDGSCCFVMSTPRSTGLRP